VILVVDNFDSFVHNLARMVVELGRKVRVVRNDAPSIEAILEGSPEAILISPGPCDPARAGISLAVVRELGGRIPVLGICLGHQVIGEAYGGRVVKGEPVHGRADAIHHDQKGIFRGIPSPFHAARYHSLVVSHEGLPPELGVAARTDDGAIMALRHGRHPVTGLQFHPESVLTECGYALLENFLAEIG
jgi:anthranilate synthase/aminodeoxychorismate synthase-like glutamine amidotransferase